LKRLNNSTQLTPHLISNVQPTESA